MQFGQKFNAVGLISIDSYGQTLKNLANLDEIWATVFSIGQVSTAYLAKHWIFLQILEPIRAKVLFNWASFYCLFGQTLKFGKFRTN